MQSPRGLIGAVRNPYYGWVVVAACFLGSFTVYGVSYSFGVFLDRMLAEFEASRGATSLVFGVQTISLYVGASLIGVLVDRYGTRRSLVAGLVVTASGLVLASRANSLAALVVTYGVVTGLGLSVVYVVSYATVTRWFDRRLGFAAGIASAGLGVGMLAVVPAATWLIARIGWRDALVALAVGVIAVLAVAALLIRNDPQSVESDAPAGEFPGAIPTGNTQSLPEQYETIRPLATSGPFVLLFAGWVLVYASLYVVLAHLVLHAGDVGLTRETGALALAALGTTSALGRVGIGYIADALGRLRVFVASSATMGLAMLAFLAVQSPLLFVGVGALYGLGYGGNGALLSPLTADLFGRANINALFGLVSLAFGLSGLIAPAAAGATYDAMGTYEPAFLVTGVLALAGAAAVAAAGRLA